ncbi:hypothetical protein FQA39_LY02036 [Lamprigera yunnana]|nr:hypothetical protein FQA39_LY02036 [Lamprigera yunnana]
MMLSVLRNVYRNTHVHNLKFNLTKCFSSNTSNIIYSSLSNVEIPEVKLHELVYENYHKFPNKIAVECSSTGKKYTFEEIRRKSNNLNKALRKILGLKRNDVLAFLLPNMPEFLICILGGLEADLTLTFINPSYTPEEVKNQLLDSNAKTIVTLSVLNPLIDAALAGVKSKPPVVNIKLQHQEVLPENTIDFHDLVNTRFDVKEVNSNDVNDTAFLLYSSGTTGKPKGVKLSHKNIVSNLCQVDHPMIRTGYDTTGYKLLYNTDEGKLSKLFVDSHQDVLPSILPWFHTSGLTVLLCHTRYLSKLISFVKFTPEAFINTIIKCKPHLLFVVPSLVSFICNEKAIQKEHLECVRALLCGAAPLGVLEEEKLSRKTNGRMDILQAYGMTETSPFVLTVCSSRKKVLGFKGSVGEVIPNTAVKIVAVDDLNGDALGPNTPGELFVKGPQVTAGYHNRTKESEEAFTDGWLKTGDLVYYDDNKQFYVQDRLKEIIKVKGHQVAPAELEDIIRTYPDVLDAAVIGVANSRYGEVPHAYVVLKPNTKFDTKQLQDYVAGHVAEYKTLKGGVTIVQSIPKNASGKILRKDLKLQHKT